MSGPFHVIVCLKCKTVQLTQAKKKKGKINILCRNCEKQIHGKPAVTRDTHEEAKRIVQYLQERRRT